MPLRGKGVRRQGVMVAKGGSELPAQLYTFLAVKIKNMTDDESDTLHCISHSSIEEQLNLCTTTRHLYQANPHEIFT